MGVNKIVIGDEVKVDLTADTVTADKLQEGCTAHNAAGNPIIGELPNLIDLQLLAPIMSSGLSIVTYNEMKCIRSTCTAIAASKYGIIGEETKTVSVNVPASDFGNATAADVVAGKTFTSSAGIKIPGTATEGGSSSGGSLPSTIVAGDTPVLASWTGAKVSTSTVTDTGLSLTITKAGTYRFKVPSAAASSYMSGSPTVYLYKNGTQAASNTVSSSAVSPLSFDIDCAAGDVVTVRAAGAGSSWSVTAVIVLALIACIDWDNGL